ncbi:hypothetical protein N7448_007449 [Penicillium atrosanguineum]|uniref:Uncharacterized protein n=1 Tax=Penicillium atrosanguineum TaxID=1132637 RepID=A0A9W9GPB2_9EURO|nr:uncharacterized protein N7443_001524 [Penicillium atrosanguineum]KAJ5126670.1 hypothetical protein N7448_007449 [Penicillium atrosanguineum]KAJ5314640.1 hypothetical protein N7443_001524 [Penicillium atrosanguineum]KAJ5331811.1 hypothetical protein N7476_001594 [Penicillium atrosanguineum]
MEFSRLPLLPIPASIRRRLPRLYPSHRAGADTESGGALRHSSSEPHLPLPGHESLTEIAVEMRPSTASDDLSFDSSGGSSPREETGVPTKYETESGLRWNRVVPAFNLLRNAGYEAQQPHADSRLARSLYINATMYLLDALPPDLSAEETLMIAHRLPQPVKASIAAEPQIHLTRLEGSGEARPGPPARSYLHRLLASVIVQIFLLVRFILPYAKLFLRNVYEYERSHRLTERIVTTTLDAADGLSKSSVTIGSAVCKLNEGKLGTVVGNLAAWWVEGIAGGVYEGVGEDAR